MEERRKEPREPLELTVEVRGRDSLGHLFLQIARARNISRSGALLQGLECTLRPGDIVGIQYGDQQAKFSVVWARAYEQPVVSRVAVHKLAGYDCPWQDVLAMAVGD